MDLENFRKRPFVLLAYNLRCFGCDKEIDEARHRVMPIFTERTAFRVCDGCYDSLIKKVPKIDLADGGTPEQWAAVERQAKLWAHFEETGKEWLAMLAMQAGLGAE